MFKKGDRLKAEQLMQPRYKVIARYPDTPFEVGQILQTSNDSWVDESGTWCIDVSDFDDYPAIFQPLQWWEERAVEDLPEYVNCSGYQFSGTRYPVGIYKVAERMIHVHGGQASVRTEDGRILHYSVLTPATQSEYEAFTTPKP